MTKLYTDEHRSKHEHAYVNNPNWGNNYPYMFNLANDQTVTHIDLVEQIKPTSLLDYGCGNGLILNDFTDIVTYGYDPFVEKYSTYPTIPCDLVLSFNALSHVEPQYFDTVLNDLKFLTKKHLVVNVMIGPLHPERTKDWYVEKFSQHFTIQSCFLSDPMLIPGIENKIISLSALALWCQR